MIINLTVGKLIELLGEGKTNLGHDFIVHKIASLTQAGMSDMAVLIDRGDQSVFDATSLDEIKKSSAGLLLAVHELIEGKNYLLVKDPLQALQAIVDFVTSQASQEKAFEIASDAIVHPSAVISSGAKIQSKASIGAQVFVGKDCLIGSQVVLHPGVKVLDRCIVSDFSIIHSGAVIGSDGFGYQVTSYGLRKIPQVGIVRVGRYVEIGSNSTIDRASFDETVIGDGVKIDNSVHVAHNVQIGAGTAILAQTGIAGSVIIGKGCQIGGQVALKDHIRIGNGVKIVSKSGVMSHLEDGAIVAGVPSMPFNQWKRLCVVLTKLPDLVKTFRGVKVDREEKQENKSFWRRLFLGRW